MFTTNNYYYFDGCGDNKLLPKILETINYLKTKIDQIMTKQERFDAILTKLDTVTTDLAGDFKTFIEEAKTGTVSDESLAKAEANVIILEQLAASKENPIPNEPPIPPVDTNA
jgi:hypothetical protein